jgi:hypothetical protein
MYGPRISVHHFGTFPVRDAHVHVGEIVGGGPEKAHRKRPLAFIVTQRLRFIVTDAAGDEADVALRLYIRHAGALRERMADTASTRVAASPMPLECSTVFSFIFHSFG